MARSVKKFGFPAVVLFAFFFVSAVLTTCSNDIIGFGDAIQFTAPDLTMDKSISNPFYVRGSAAGSTAVAFGTCGNNNVPVGRVICVDADNPSKIYGNAVVNGKSWRMTFNFKEADNGQKFAVKFVAEGKTGLSSEQGTAYRSLIVDLRAPLFKDPYISRSPARATMNLKPLAELKLLETRDDIYGNSPDFVDSYQNGTFWIDVEVEENETFLIDDISKNSIVMYLYDENHENSERGDKPVYFNVKDSDSSPYAPRWTVKESDIVKGALVNLGLDYETDLNNGKRIYLRVRFAAEDRSGNRNKDLVDDFGYLCLYRDADIPKARPAGGIADGARITGEQTTIPVDVYDDDEVEIAWIGLMKLADFNAISGATEEDKLIKIKEDLCAGTVVNDWDNKPFKNYVLDYPAGTWPTRLPESFTVTLELSSDPANYTEYRLIAIVKDRKSMPHYSKAHSDYDYDPSTPFGPALMAPPQDKYMWPADTENSGWQPVWGLYATSITLADENAPLVVIDTVNTTLPLLGTPEVSPQNAYDPESHLGKDIVAGASTGDSPEENTFPRLFNGRYFTINGYTLDMISNQSILNDPAERGKVKVFRMAYIPNGGHNTTTYPRGQDDPKLLSDVLEALAKPTQVQTNYPPGVQFWELPIITPAAYASASPKPTSYIMEGTQQDIGGVKYTKQSFYKQFDILGGPDDRKASEYDNFTRVKGNTGTFENAPKLFVLYAEDMDGNPAQRTIRLLGNLAPPSLKIYDFTTDVRLLSNATDSLLNTNANAIIPDAPTSSSGISQQTPFHVDDAGQQSEYYKRFYNGILKDGYKLPIVTGPPPVYPSDGYNDSHESVPFRALTPGTTYKIWAEAAGDGGVAITELRMYDISTGTPNYNDPTDPLMRGYRHIVDAAGNCAISSPCIHTHGSPAVPYSNDLSFVMRFPDRDVRTFMFIAKNSLGIETRLQRTIAITSTALLVDIISPLSSGIYGFTPKIPKTGYVGQWDPADPLTYPTDVASATSETVKFSFDQDRIITLQAHFSSAVRVRRGPNESDVPLLNIRYQNGSGIWVYVAVPFSGTFIPPAAGATDWYSDPNIYLEFKWAVPPDAKGRVETLDFTHRSSAFPANTLVKGDRPINLNNAQILDNSNLDQVFLPRGDIAEDGYNLPSWNDSSNSLQGMTLLGGQLDPTYPGKQIQLDGSVPRATLFQAAGKEPWKPYSSSTPTLPAEFYFKAGETITLELQANKALVLEGDPKIEFEIWYPFVPGSQAETAYKTKYSSFTTSTRQGTTWTSTGVRQAGQNGFVFMIEIPEAGNALLPNYPNGTIKITGITSTPTNRIADRVGNALVINNLVEPVGSNPPLIGAPYGGVVPVLVIDRKVPPQVPPRIADPANPGTSFAPLLTGTPPVARLNYNPLLIMTGTGSGLAPEFPATDANAEPWGSDAQYSLDGISWVDNDKIKDKWTRFFTDGKTPQILSGQFELSTRQLDRAGNISDASATYSLDINSKFPELISIGAIDPAKVYLKGEDIHFSLDFESPVYTTNTNAYIVVADRYYRTAAELAILRSILNELVQEEEDEYQMYVRYSNAKNISGNIPVVAKPANGSDKSGTLQFPWLNINGKQMPNGITVRTISLAGVQDEYLNDGVSSYSVRTTGSPPVPATTFTTTAFGDTSRYSTSTPPNNYNGKVIMYKNFSDVSSTLNFPDELGEPLMDPASPTEWNPASKFYTVDNIAGNEYQVFTIPPSLIDANPRLVGLKLYPDNESNATLINETNGGSSIVSEGRTSITLIFDDYVKVNSGFIRIRPHGNYPLPPWFPAEAYVVNDPQDLDNGVRLASFFEVYNSSYMQEEAEKLNTSSGGVINYTAAAAQVTTWQNYLRRTTSTWVGNTDYAMYDATATGRTLITDSKGLDLRTGLDYGPYRNTTQGLVPGKGYTADPDVALAYNAMTSTEGTSIPNPTTGYNGKAVNAAEAETNWNVVSHPTSDFMVPDTSSKFVLDFKYPLLESGVKFFPAANAANGGYGDAATTTQLQTAWTNRMNADIANIRAALNAAHYRWRDIDVLSSAVLMDPSYGSPTKPPSLSSRVVIALDKLPAGMQWDVTIDAGAFTDEVGNPIDAVGANAYWFWSGGVQKPVIRVDRRSMDYRSTVDRRDEVGIKSGGGNIFPYTPRPTVDGAAADNTQIDGFNFIAYRVETETPGVSGAQLRVATLKGQSQIANDTAGHAYGAIQINAWTGALVNGTGTAGTTNAGWGQASWSGPTTQAGTLATNTMGEWVRPNLIRREITGKGLTNYGLIYRAFENGSPVTHTGNGNLKLLRSYNRDANKAQLDTQFNSSAANVNTATKYYMNIRAQTSITNAYLQSAKASKNYIIAEATAPHAGTGTKTAKGYEGIFKTVVVWNTGQDKSSNPAVFAPNDNGMAPVQILGSDSLSPTPTIPGFPMMLQNIDPRYEKIPTIDGAQPGAGPQITWMSTEIVSSWFISGTCWSDSSGLLTSPKMLNGDAGAYISAGYGDLVHTFNQDM